MAAEATEGDTEELSTRRHNYPRDLLRRFAASSCQDEPLEAADGDLGEVELSLSLGGSFGFEPKDKGLVRSSSIATLSTLPIEHEFSAVPPLARTCSLPIQPEEDRRKRKEIQSLKRLEAKRKRSEKRSVKAGIRERREESLDEEMEGGEVPVGPTAVKAEVCGCPGFRAGTQMGGTMNGVVPPKQPKWAMCAGRPGFGPISQGSIGSQGSCSSGVSDFECRPLHGFIVKGLSNCTEASSSTMIPSVPDRPANKIASTAMVGKPAKSSRGEEEQSKKRAATGREANGTTTTGETERDVLEEMPCVSTKGDGPNGRRIEGFLYRYRKGEEVRIVCVCHGSFLTPAEFVKHAGGSDVAHPLRHIVVSPAPSAF